MKAFFLNRDCDAALRDRLRAAWPATFPPLSRVVAIDPGSGEIDPATHPLARADWFGQAEIKRGPFCAFLSHARAWEEIAAGPDALGIVLEDTVLPLPDLGPVIADWNGDTDILFFNEAISAWTRAHGGAARSVPAAVAELVRANWRLGQDVPHPGAAGYALTRGAARHLLARMPETGLRMGVDWFLLAACLAPGDFPAGHPGYHVFTYLRDHASGQLSGRILGQPLCRAA